MLESSVEEYFRLAVERAGGRAEKTVDLTRIGAPDREVQWPGLGIDKVELKKPKGDTRGGVCSSMQIRYHEYLARCCVPVYLIDTKDKVDHYVESRTMDPPVHAIWLFSVPCPLHRTP